MHCLALKIAIPKKLHIKKTDFYKTFYSKKVDEKKIQEF